VRFTAAGYALAAFAVLFTLGSLVLAAFLWNQSQDQAAERDRLEREGVTAEATLTRVWRTGGKDSTHRISYTFDAGGQSVEGSSRVPREIWRSLKEGDRIPIRYLPTDPSNNHPAAWPTNVTPEWVVIFVPVSFISVTGLLAWMLRKQWRLLAEGRPAPGVVTKSRQVKNQKILHYQFRTIDGAIHKGRSNARQLMRAGEPVCVLYDPENPRSSQVYPLPLVKLQ
jgi:hypothetical protein